MAHLPIVGLKHPAVQAARALNRPSVRRERGRYLVEGEKLVHLALRSPARVEAVFLAADLREEQKSAWTQTLGEDPPPTYGVSRGVLFKIIGTPYSTSVEAVAVVAPGPLPEEWWAPPRGVVVAAEAVEDPRNVGVLLRTADAAGAHGLVLDEACGDPYSRPAIRSSTGSVLFLPVSRWPRLQPWLQEARSRGFKVVATSAHAPRSHWDTDLTGPCIVLVGNETTGLSPALRQGADVEVAIPLYGTAHSLNVAVAAGIVLYEWVRQQRSGHPGGMI